MMKFGLLMLNSAVLATVSPCGSGPGPLDLGEVPLCDIRTDPLDLCEKLGFFECEFFAALDGVERILHGTATVYLTESIGCVSEGLRDALINESQAIFTLTSGSAFITTEDPSDDADLKETSAARLILFFLFQTEHVILGTEGTSYFVEIDHRDGDTVFWTVFDRFVVLKRRDETPWPDGSMEVRIETGQTFMTVRDNQPKQQDEKPSEERNQILSQINEVAFENDDLLHVLFVDGLMQTEAIRLIEDAGLVPTAIDIDAEIVVGTDPPGGAAVEPGSEIQLLYP